jgi:hypothetical protein
MATKSKKATAHDAQIILQLYDLRREPVMRKARNFMATEFWPSSYDELKAIMFAFGSEHNAYARQALTFWDMAAAMVLEGVIHEDLFFRCNGELYFFFAKFGHYLPQLRKDSANPEFLMNFEKLATKSSQSRERIKRTQEMLKTRAAAQAAKAGD